MGYIPGEKQLVAMCKGKPNMSNLRSVKKGLESLSKDHELLQLQVLPHYLCQIMHESGSFKWDREIWGPTPAQKRYEGRKDLGNTQKGDGKKFMGHTGIQITGRTNTTKFWKWCVRTFPNLKVPNFVEHPELMNMDPWEGLGPIWYWMEGNPKGKPLTPYALQNNITMITKLINGGKNGLEDRIDYYGRCALILLGYQLNKGGIKKFQEEHPKAGVADGVIGDKTRHAMHLALGGENPFKEIERHVEETVVEKKVPVPSKDLEKPWYKTPDGLKEVVTTVGGPSILSFFTDIPTEKLLILAGFLAAGSIAWYLIRRSQKAAQKAAAKQIEDSGYELRSKSIRVGSI